MDRVAVLSNQVGAPYARLPTAQRAVIVAGTRTPFSKAFGELMNLDTIDLGAVAVKGLIDNTKVPVDQIDHIAWGGVILRTGCPNTAREIAIDLKLPSSISAHTETMACASGLKSILSAVQMIESGNAEVVIAGGSDSTSCTEVPLARNVSQSLGLYSQGKIGISKVFSVAGLPCTWMPNTPAVAERSTGKTMGYHADVMSELCGVKRHEQDEFAMGSHRKAAAAAAMFASEIIPVSSRGSALQPAVTVKNDTMIRAKQDPKKIASLKPVFRPATANGTVTAATASPLTDGAAAVLVMTAAKAKALGYSADVAIRSWAASGINPNPNLLLAPAIAIPIALRRAGLKLSDIDYFEIHEAFAGQVLATINVLGSAELSKKYLGVSEAIGTIELKKVNIYGGSLSIGHPFGATGARLVTNAARILRQNSNAKYVLISVCAAGGLGLVTIVERL